MERSAHFEKERVYVSFLNTSGDVTDICPIFCYPGGRGRVVGFYTYSRG